MAVDTTTKRVQHRRNLSSAISDIWNNSAQSAFYSLARSQKRITKGKIILHGRHNTFQFPADTPPSSPQDRAPLSPLSYHTYQSFESTVPEAEIVVKNNSFFLRVAASPDIGFAEAYMYGDIDVEPDHLIEVFRIFVLNRKDAFAPLTSSALTKLFSVPARLTVGRFVNSLQNSHSNISAHYDLGNDMFKTFLSKDMTYSCPIFPSLDRRSKLRGLPVDDSEALYDAQMRKLRHIIEKAKICPGDRVLEIGSGWGSLSFFIAETVEETVIDTITLSVQQAQYVQEKIKEKGLESRVRVHLMDYRALPKEWEHAFDRVVSIEMIEAVGKEYYETYFSQIDWALKLETGVAVVQSSTIAESRYDDYVKTEDFILFPGGLLPTIAVMTSASHAGSSGRLVVESVNNIGPHYVRTLREWRRGFESGFVPSGDNKYGAIEQCLRDEFPDVMNGPRAKEEIEVFRRKWIYYLYALRVLAHAELTVHILTLIREGNTDYGCQVFG
ncbi:S-adenosyl-L-methionine-dependent methyltransferase [Cytidiella melzeri]|nr:S-adenosyl-L-methionine-dependent methyltransferase [Cytidiella melzeri]